MVKLERACVRRSEQGVTISPALPDDDLGSSIIMNMSVLLGTPGIAVGTERTHVAEPRTRILAVLWELEA